MKLSSVSALAALLGAGLVYAAPTAEAESSIFDHLRLDDDGSVHLGADGVLRSLGAGHNVVIDYIRLSPAQLTRFGVATHARLDGRDVTSEAQLFAVPTIEKREPEADFSPVKRDGALFARACSFGCITSSNCKKVNKACKVCVSNTGSGAGGQCAN